LTIILRKSNTIQRLIAATLLLLFSFCVTPKRVLHDLLANHRDAQTSPHLPQKQIAASGFHCHIDDLVVVAPYLPGIQAVIVRILSSAPRHFTQHADSFSLTCRSLREGRGPPAHFSI
jgi:hypothetical protein